MKKQAKPELPRYRAKDWVQVYGMLHRPDEEIVLAAWPKPAHLLEPINEAAREVWGFQAQNSWMRAYAELPFPYDAMSGECLLPKASEQVPRYTALRTMYLPGVGAQSVGCTFEFVRWPWNEDVRPVNETARAIFAYWKEHRDECPSEPPWDIEGKCLRLPIDKAAA